jgi:hypothetical protein
VSHYISSIIIACLFHAVVVMARSIASARLPGRMIGNAYGATAVGAYS